jgi:hypothetical protein
MKRLIVLFLLLTGVLLGRHQHVSIPHHSTIYINAQDDMATFVIAALREKEVDLVPVTSPDKADYILDSSAFHTHDGAAAGAGSRLAAAFTYRVSEAAFTLTSKSGEIVWSYAVTKYRGRQSMCEALAKHLRDDAGF